ncbi:hypothetical protein FIM1_3055 [Kluyveromyces marxianus]|uniref:Transmembrane protein n=1 Tax=Kluyveromyces marxianus TaxID=4911 RepID=A0ABX6EZP1_KLUMA|nr:hypothetical protein FIM1_3055 [Kluyveromyces marxianus]
MQQNPSCSGICFSRAAAALKFVFFLFFFFFWFSSSFFFCYCLFLSSRLTPQFWGFFPPLGARAEESVVPAPRLPFIQDSFFFFVCLFYFLRLGFRQFGGSVTCVCGALRSGEGKCFACHPTFEFSLGLGVTRPLIGPTWSCASHLLHVQASQNTKIMLATCKRDKRLGIKEEELNMYAQHRPVSCSFVIYLEHILENSF